MSKKSMMKTIQLRWAFQFLFLFIFKSLILTGCYFSESERNFTGIQNQYPLFTPNIVIFDQEENNFELKKDEVENLWQGFTLDPPSAAEYNLNIQEYIGVDSSEHLAESHDSFLTAPKNSTEALYLEENKMGETHHFTIGNLLFFILAIFLIIPWIVLGLYTVLHQGKLKEIKKRLKP